MFSQFGLEKFFLRSVIATNSTISSLFESAHEFPSTSRTVLNVRDSTKFTPIQSNKYCFVMVVPEDNGPKRMQMMQQQLELVFDYKAQIIEKMMPVKVLKVLKGVNLNLTVKKDTSGLSTRIIFGEGLKLINQRIDGLAKFAETRMKMPVIDETALDGRFDLNIVSYDDDVQNLNVEIRKLGLVLVDAQRIVKILVINDK